MNERIDEPECRCGFAFGLQIQCVTCPYHGTPEFVPQPLPEGPITTATLVVRAQHSAETIDLRP